MRRDPPSACAILVAHDSQELLPGAVEGLRRHAGEMELKIVVVDCGSADRSAEVARGLGVDEVVEAPNLGYGAGNNLGARTETAKGCEWLVFVNPDAHPVAGDLASLLEAARQAGASVAAPAFADPGDGVTREPSLMPAGRGSGRRALRRLARGQREFVPREGWSSVDGPRVEFECALGAFLAVRRDWFERLGGFDERYFLYFEDLDLQARSRVSGGLHLGSDCMVVVHDRPAEVNPPAIQAQLYLARLVWRTEQRGRLALLLARMRLAFSVLLRWRSWPGGREARNACLRICLVRLPSDAAGQRKLQAERLGSGAR